MPQAPAPQLRRRQERDGRRARGGRRPCRRRVKRRVPQPPAHQPLRLFNLTDAGLEAKRRSPPAAPTSSTSTSAAATTCKRDGRWARGGRRWVPHAPCSSTSTSATAGTRRTPGSMPRGGRRQLPRPPAPQPRQLRQRDGRWAHGGRRRLPQPSAPHPQFLRERVDDGLEAVASGCLNRQHIYLANCGNLANLTVFGTGLFLVPRCRSYYSIYS